MEILQNTSITLTYVSIIAKLLQLLPNEKLWRF